MWGESHNKQRKSNKNKYGDGTGESEVESHDEDDVGESDEEKRGRGVRGTGWLSCKTRTHSCYTCSYSSWKSLNINFAQQKVKPCGATKAIRLIGVVEGMSWRLFCRSREGGVAGGSSTLHVLRVLISHARIMSNAHLMLPPSRMWLVEGKQRKSEAYYPPYMSVCVCVCVCVFPSILCALLTP